MLITYKYLSVDFALNRVLVNRVRVSNPQPEAPLRPNMGQVPSHPSGLSLGIIDKRQSHRKTECPAEFYHSGKMFVVC